MSTDFEKKRLARLLHKESWKAVHCMRRNPKLHAPSRKRHPRSGGKHTERYR